MNDPDAIIAALRNPIAILLDGQVNKLEGIIPLAGGTANYQVYKVGNIIRIDIKPRVS